MTKKIVVISTSLRVGSNSDILADAFIKGAKDAGNEVEKILLKDKTISFCKGCLACQSMKTGHCVMKDDADSIINQMATADVIAFATPIYFYEMSGQMKTLLDRTNPLFPISYSFRDIYLLATAAETDKSAMDGAITGLQGWIDCFDKAELSGVLHATGIDDANAILNNEELIQSAYELGKHA